MVFLVQCSHTERMNSAVQSNPRELDQTSVWFQSEHLAFSLVQSSPGTFKLRRKPVQSQSTSVKIGATLTKRIGSFPSADRLNGILIVSKWHDRSLSRRANWFDTLFEANLTYGCSHHSKFFKKFTVVDLLTHILQSRSVISSSVSV